MIIFLYGEDSYRRLKKRNEILAAYQKKYTGLSESHFDLGEAGGIDRLKEFVINRSMFDPVKLAVIEGVFSAENKKELQEILQAHVKDKETILLVLSEAGPPRDFGFLTKEGVPVQEFLNLAGAPLAQFIKKEAELRGLELDEPTTAALKEIFEGDSWGIVTELDKLAALGGKAIELKGRPTGNFYELINALKGKPDYGERLVALELLLSGLKEEPARIFNVLAFRLPSAELSRKFSDYDLLVKSGKLDYEETLVHLALS